MCDRAAPLRVSPLRAMPLAPTHAAPPPSASPSQPPDSDSRPLGAVTARPRGGDPGSADTDAEEDDFDFGAWGSSSATAKWARSSGPARGAEGAGSSARAPASMAADAEEDWRGGRGGSRWGGTKAKAWSSPQGDEWQHDKWQEEEDWGGRGAKRKAARANDMDDRRAPSRGRAVSSTWEGGDASCSEPATHRCLGRGVIGRIGAWLAVTRRASRCSKSVPPFSVGARALEERPSRQTHQAVLHERASTGAPLILSRLSGDFPANISPEKCGTLRKS